MSRIRREIISASLGAYTHVDGSLNGRFRFGDGFVGFAGHFPGYPLMPAVAQVVLGQVVAEALAGAPLAMTTLEKAKFVREIRPNEEVLAECRRMELKGRAGYEVRLSVAGETASSFVLVSAADGALA